MRVGWRVLVGGLVLGTVSAAASLPAAASVELRLPADTRQMVLVVTRKWESPDGTLQRYERRGPTSPWQPVGRATAVNIGTAGLGWGRGLTPLPPGPEPVKQEGDHRAPAGVFRLSAVFGYAPARAVHDVHLPYIHLTKTTEGVDDPHSAYYNRVVDRAQVAHPDWRSSEKMRRSDDLYRWGVIVDCNTSPAPVPGAGSCIFLHLWSGPGRGTEGCTAMAAAPLDALVHWLRRADAPVLVQLPRSVYAEARARGALPPGIILSSR